MQPSMRIHHIDWHGDESVLQKEQRDLQSTQTLSEAGRGHESVQSIATDIEAEVVEHIS